MAPGLTPVQAERIFLTQLWAGNHHCDFLVAPCSPVSFVRISQRGRSRWLVPSDDRVLSALRWRSSHELVFKLIAPDVAGLETEVWDDMWGLLFLHKTLHMVQALILSKDQAATNTASSDSWKNSSLLEQISFRFNRWTWTYITMNRV